MARLVRLVAALSIVLGIFGMHALSHHGTTHEPAPTTVTTAATGAVTAARLPGDSAAMTMGAGLVHDQHQAGPAALRNEAPDAHPPSANGHRAAPDPDGHGTGTSDTGDPGHSLGDMVMLCVAMLVAAAASLLTILGLLRRVPRVWAVLCPAVIARVTRQVAPRGTGPPPVWQFSVIRC